MIKQTMEVVGVEVDVKYSEQYCSIFFEKLYLGEALMVLFASGLAKAAYFERDGGGLKVFHASKDHTDNIFVDGERLVFSTSAHLSKGDEIEVKVDAVGDFPQVHVTRRDKEEED